jgi:hypothetical protein
MILYGEESAEQVVAPDASRTSPSHAGCNRLRCIVVRKSLNRLLFWVLGFACNRHALTRHGLRG